MNIKANDSYELKLTKDGTFTFFSLDFQEDFHSYYGAKQEAEKKFVDPCLLREKASKNPSLILLDICYGLGYNSAAALANIWQVNPQCFVKLVALDIDNRVAIQAINHNLIDIWGAKINKILTELAINNEVNTNLLQAELLKGDARITLQQIAEKKIKADAIFLDPFSPPKCPQLWTVEFLDLVAKCLNTTGRMATYSCAASVRSALEIVGLNIGASESVGRRSPGTIASWSNEQLPPLSQQELEHLKTRAAIPYRDPYLKDSAQEIIKRREQEQNISTLEPTSHWKKRWNQ